MLLYFIYMCITYFFIGFSILCITVLLFMFIYSFQFAFSPVCIFNLVLVFSIVLPISAYLVYYANEGPSFKVTVGWGKVQQTKIGE